MTTARDVERTARDTTIAQWGVAAVVMVGSAASAGIGFSYLGEHWSIGVLTGLGVDLALASWLVVGHRLRAVGVTTFWGQVLLWLTGLMTLLLNSGAAALQGQWVLAVAHAFLPVLLVVLCEAGSEAQLKLLRVRQDRDATERADRAALEVAARAARDAESSRAERARADETTRRELAAAQHQREMTDRHQAREHQTRLAVGMVASQLALGAAWRARPTRRPTPTPGRPRVTTRKPGGRKPAPSPTPDVGELVPVARRLLAGEPELGRREIARRLGVSEHYARQAMDRIEAEGTPLHIVTTGGRPQ